LTKKWGILIKKESKSLEFTGLKIPRDYYLVWRFLLWQEEKMIYHKKQHVVKNEGAKF